MYVKLTSLIVDTKPGLQNAAEFYVEYLGKEPYRPNSTSLEKHKGSAHLRAQQPTEDEVHVAFLGTL